MAYPSAVLRIFSHNGWWDVPLYSASRQFTQSVKISLGLSSNIMCFVAIWSALLSTEYMVHILFSIIMVYSATNFFFE